MFKHRDTDSMCDVRVEWIPEPGSSTNYCIKSEFCPRPRYVERGDLSSIMNFIICFKHFVSGPMEAFNKRHVWLHNNHVYPVIAT